MNRTVLKIRKINSSITFLLAVLLGLASCIMLIIEKVVFEKINPFTLATFFEGNNLNTILANFLISLNRFEFIFAILSILSLLSLLAFYVSNRIKYVGRVPLFGAKAFSVCKVIEILGITGFYIFATYFTANSILDIIFDPGFSESSSSTGVIVNIAIIFALLIALFVFIIIYYSKTFKTLACIRKTLKTGVIVGRVSVFVLGINFALSLVFIASCVFCTVTNSIALISVSKIFMGISFALFSLYLFNLRKVTLRIAKKGGENDHDEKENPPKKRRKRTAKPKIEEPENSEIPSETTVETTSSIPKVLSEEDKFINQVTDEIITQNQIDNIKEEFTEKEDEFENFEEIK